MSCIVNELRELGFLILGQVLMEVGSEVFWPKLRMREPFAVSRDVDELKHLIQEFESPKLPQFLQPIPVVIQFSIPNGLAILLVPAFISHVQAYVSQPWPLQVPTQLHHDVRFDYLSVTSKVRESVSVFTMEMSGYVMVMGRLLC